MNKKGMAFTSMVIVLMALMVGFAVTSNVDFDVDKFKENLEWKHQDINVSAAPDLGNALESLLNGLGETAFSFIKWVAQWSSEHPEVPFKLLIYLLLLSIFAPLIFVLFKLIIVVWILIKEIIQSSKEKRLKRELYKKVGGEK